MNLAPASVPLVYRAIAEALGVYPGDDLTGISCIAHGADSIFAQAVLDLGGKLEVVLPSRNYRAQKVRPDHAGQFDNLLGRAETVHVLSYDEANRDAYEAANNVVLSLCDRLFAIWDGQAGVDKGSTASVVADARARGLPVEVIWPEGAARS